MGVVERQSLKFSLVSLGGVVLGVVSTIFIYPNYLAQYGFTQGVIGIVFLLLPFCQMGLQSVILKHYNTFIDKEENSLFVFTMLWLFTAISFFGIVVYLFGNFLESLVNNLNLDNNIFNESRIEVFLLIIFGGLSSTLVSISTLYKRIAFPHLIRNIIGNKVLIPIIIIIVGYYLLPLSYLLFLLIIKEALIAGILFLYGLYNGWIKFQAPKLKHKKEELKSILKFGMFSILDEAGSAIAFSIDIVMVNILLGNVATGVYSLFVFLTNVLKIPLVSIVGITKPIISENWRKGRIAQISSLYKKSASMMLLVTIGVFLLIAASLSDLLLMIDKFQLIEGIYIFFILSIGIIITTMTGLNRAIIVQSKEYKWNLIFTLLLAGLNLLLTYVFIVYIFPDPYKSAGAACSTVISLVLVNLFRTVFLYIKFGMHPFEKSMFYMISFGIILLLLTALIPSTSFLLIDIILKSTFISIAYFGSALYFNWSIDFNVFVNKKMMLFRK